MTRPGANQDPAQVPLVLGPVLIDSARIEARVRELGAEISTVHGSTPVHLVVVMTGAWMFAADLARSIRSPVYCHFVQASSYGAGTLSSPSVRVSGAAPPGLRGEHLLLVDDIVDTGRTVAALIARLQAHRPRSLHVASLLSKPARRAVEVPIDFLGFEVPDEFVVGYGLDFAGHHRGLPDVHVLVPKQA